MRWQSLEELRFAPEWSKKAKQLNGQEWLWKSYEGKSFATEIPLKLL